MVAVEWKLVEHIIIFFEKNVVARSFTANSNLLQPTGSVNRTPSHVTLFSSLHACLTVSHVTLAQGSRLKVSCASSHPCFMRLSGCAFWSLFDSPFCTLHNFSHLLLHPPNLHHHFLCGSVRREVPCALPRMRSLTLWSTMPLSQVLSPSSSTTTTSQRPLKFSSRSPPATAGPRTCTTRRSVTTPSAERSLHHCSFRSEKIQRAVDKLITRLKKVCCQVSHCLSDMWERGDPLMSLDH